MISVFQIWTSIGSLIGTIIDNATHNIPNRNSYLIPLGCIYIIPVFLSIGLFFIPESPRWLMLMERHDEASKAMLWMRPHPESVPDELAEIQAAIDAEKAIKASANFLDIWRDPVDRRRTLLAIAAVSTQAASGAMFVIAYGTYFFQVSLNCSLLHPCRKGVNMKVDGECWQPIHEQLYPYRRWRPRRNGELKRHLKNRTTSSIPHDWVVTLRSNTTHHRWSVSRKSWYSWHWQGTS